MRKTLCIIISIIFLWWIYYLYISPYLHKQNIIDVPQIIGLSEIEAIEVLESSNLKYNINYIDGDDEIVVDTMPTVGMQVYEKSVIDVFINKPLPAYYMSFVGLIYDSNVELIKSFCKKYNIEYQLLYEKNDNYISGQIIKQSKSKDTLISEKDIIIFTIATNDSYFSMPNLVGMHIKDCIKLLDSYNLNYNIIYFNSPIDEDIVISQSISEGVTLKKGNKYIFDIYVSIGI